MWKLIKIDSLSFVLKSRTLHCSHGNLPYLTFTVEHVTSLPPDIQIIIKFIFRSMCVLKPVDGNAYTTVFIHSMSSTDIPHLLLPPPECVSWLGQPLWFLLWSQDAIQEETIRELRRIKFVTNPCMVHSTPKDHIGGQEKREKKGVQTWNSVFIRAP